MTANGIIMVSAIGNDGPLYGTLNNPADMMDVIGVGGIDYSDRIASFSSRGVTTEELPHGAGRLKPDVVTYGRDVSGSKIQGGCRSLSGTSVASPVVAGAITLLASTVPEAHRWEILNPASMKQALVHTASRLGGSVPQTEQGAGKMNLVGAANYLDGYTPRATLHPAEIDATRCGYSGPHCRRSVYKTGMPLVFNYTVLNGMGRNGVIHGEPRFVPKDASMARVLDVDFTFSDVLWPWTGFLGVYVSVSESSSFTGIVEGTIEATVVSPPRLGSNARQVSVAQATLKVKVIATPPREKRVLWDIFHNIPYPPGFIPRDNLDARGDILDWHGDHPFTNYHTAFEKLVDAGYHVEFLGSSFLCFDAKNYGTLLLIDPEEEYTKEEVAKLERDVKEEGLGLAVFGEWFEAGTLAKMRFFDDNTRSWWTPVTGGANVPALNDLLQPFGIAFGSAILNGKVAVGKHAIPISSGANLVRFPAGGYAFMVSSQAASRTARGGAASADSSNGGAYGFGLTPAGKGRVAALGDSGCLDTSHQKGECYTCLIDLVKHLGGGGGDALVNGVTPLSADVGTLSTATPSRMPTDFTPFSKTLGSPEGAACGMDANRALRAAPPPRRPDVARRVVGDLSGIDIQREMARYNDEMQGYLASGGVGAGGDGVAAGSEARDDGSIVNAHGGAAGDASIATAAGGGGGSMAAAAARAAAGGGTVTALSGGARPVVSASGSAPQALQTAAVGMEPLDAVLSYGVSRTAALQIGGGVLVLGLWLAVRARSGRKLKVSGRRRLNRLNA